LDLVESIDEFCDVFVIHHEIPIRASLRREFISVNPCSSVIKQNFGEF